MILHQFKEIFRDFVQHKVKLLGSQNWTIPTNTP